MFFVFIYMRNIDLYIFFLSFILNWNKYSFISISFCYEINTVFLKWVTSLLLQFWGEENLAKTGLVFVKLLCEAKWTKTFLLFIFLLKILNCKFHVSCRYSAIQITNFFLGVLWEFESCKNFVHFTKICICIRISF